jgi:hypothetical protein
LKAILTDSGGIYGMRRAQPPIFIPMKCGSSSTLGEVVRRGSDGAYLLLCSCGSLIHPVKRSAAWALMHAAVEKRLQREAARREKQERRQRRLIAKELARRERIEAAYWKRKGL